MTLSINSYPAAPRPCKDHFTSHSHQFFEKHKADERPLLSIQSTHCFDPSSHAQYMNSSSSRKEEYSKASRRLEILKFERHSTPTSVHLHLQQPLLLHRKQRGHNNTHLSFLQSYKRQYPFASHGVSSHNALRTSGGLQSLPTTVRRLPYIRGGCAASSHEPSSLRT